MVGFEWLGQFRLAPQALRAPVRAPSSTLWADCWDEPGRTGFNACYEAALGRAQRFCFGNFDPQRYGTFPECVAQVINGYLRADCARFCRAQQLGEPKRSQILLWLSRLYLVSYAGVSFGALPPGATAYRATTCQFAQQRGGSCSTDALAFLRSQPTSQIVIVDAQSASSFQVDLVITSSKQEASALAPRGSRNFVIDIQSQASVRVPVTQVFRATPPVTSAQIRLAGASASSPAFRWLVAPMFGLRGAA